MRTHGPWQPCWISDQHQIHKSGRGPSSEHFWQVWLISVQRFQRRRLKCEKLTDERRTLTHDKSSHGLWPGELKKWTMWPILSLDKLVTKVSTRLRRAYPSRTGIWSPNWPNWNLSPLPFIRDPEDENVDNNIHPPSPLKNAFEVLMTRQNLCNKVPVKFSEEAPRFTGEFFWLGFCNEIV